MDVGIYITPTLYKPLLTEGYVNTYFYIKAINRAVEFCRGLGKTEDIPALTKRAEIKKAAILRDFYNPSSGDFCKNVNSANAFAIDIGLGDKRTLDHVAEHFRGEPWYNTGIFGTDIVTQILFSHGYADIAYKLLTGDGKNSFGRWMNDGYTTLPEYWTYLRSQNHPMFGAVVRYLYKYILGIIQDGAGYDKLIIEPKCTDLLSEASGHITTRHGKVAVCYKHTDNAITAETEIPHGCTALFRYGGCDYPLNEGTNKLTVAAKQ